MHSVSTTKMTARQFLELGEDPAGIRLELVDGEVALSPSPIPDHSYIVMKLGAILIRHVEGKKLGRIYSDVDTVFGEVDVRRPDLIFFQTSRLHIVGPTAIEGPPDLCVEIISPSSADIDRQDKFNQYQKGGVRHYWIIDPKAKSIEGFKLVRGKYRVSGQGGDNQTVNLPPFEDLDINLDELWPR